MALAAAAAGASAGLLYRWDILPLRDAFDLLRWAAYGGLSAAGVSFIGMIRSRPGTRRRGLLIALAGLCLGIAAFWVPFNEQRTALRAPAIHDITTDTQDPPVFRAVTNTRPAHANSLDYGGPELARKQKQAYPDLEPAEFDAPADRVFGEALAVARDMGWQIVASSENDGRIEAVAKTFWFGFEDDVVVRVTDAEPGTRLDVRSVSRVGVGDAGKNAARIRAFLTALNDRI